MNHAHVSLFPRDEWWVASFNSAPAALDIYVDITDAPVWPNPHEVTMVDLDLDVIRVRATGAVEVVDEDEFAAHQVRYAYPEDVIRQAREAADHLAATLNTSEPFAGAYRRWLDLVA
jgi:protein associated with RNAse G/E